MLGYLACFLLSDDYFFFFFKIFFFSIKSFKNTIAVKMSLDPDAVSLIWVQTVCKCYHETTVTGRERVVSSILLLNKHSEGSGKTGQMLTKGSPELYVIRLRHMQLSYRLAQL